MNKNIFIVLLLLGSVFSHAQHKSIVANPINLNYRFQFDEPSRREGADPVIEYFKGKYYLFASKSGGYWSSPDLANWTYIPCNSLLTQENYAPTILISGDIMYYMIGGSPRIFYTSNPDLDNWKELNTKFEYGTADPAFFKDEDSGKVYIYWGCSDKDPIVGVQVDPANGFKSIGKPVELIQHNGDKYGWEVPGKTNKEDRTGWNEGPCMIKHKGKYYLQYAAPGTEFRIYGDGVYVGDNPLGPFTYMENSPFSFKPGGFIGGAGHGHTFKDKYGNYWHVATMRISVRHSFERRLGIFPVYFSEDGDMYSHTVLTDYPFVVPDEKVDFETNDCSVKWNLLSYGKQVSASSSLSGFPPKSANDEQIETWWSAGTGNAGEWWQIDLGKQMTVNAIQVNFADQDFTTKAPNSYVYYQYYIEGSDDGENWQQLVDRKQNTKDMPHELIVLENPVVTRYLRITNASQINGKFSLYGFRVFGLGGGELPKEVTGFQIKREKSDIRRFQLNWDKQENATGYIIHWGVRPDRLRNAMMVFTNQLEAGFFNRDSKYYFSIDAFNENGITAGKSIVEGTVYLGSPYGGISRQVPGTIEAEDFNEGGQGVGYYDTTFGNSYLKYRPRDYVDIAEDRSTGALYLDNTATGEYTNYTIDVTENSFYDIDCMAVSVNATNEGSFYLGFDNEKILDTTKITVPVGPKTNFNIITAHNIYLEKGIHVMTFNIYGKICVDKFIFRKEELSGIKTPSQSSVIIFPNPSNGIFNVKSQQSGYLSVCDINGRDIYSKDSNGTSAIDISNCPSGVYILSFISDNQIYKTKLIKTS